MKNESLKVEYGCCKKWCLTFFEFFLLVLILLYYDIFCICVLPKLLCIWHSSFFPLFFLLVAFSGQTGKSFLNNVGQLSLHIYVTKIESLSLGTPAIYCGYVLKFRLCEHGWPCALEINSNDGFKQGHVESYPSTNKNIMFPLPQCMPLATKLSRLVTFEESLPPMKSHFPWIRWFFEIP